MTNIIALFLARRGLFLELSRVCPFGYIIWQTQVSGLSFPGTERGLKMFGGPPREFENEENHMKSIPT